MESPPAQVVHLDQDKKILIVERANFIFVFNFSVASSIPDYQVRVPSGTTLRVLLDSDATDFGGHGRVDPACRYPLDAQGILKIYSPSRSGLVFGPV